MLLDKNMQHIHLIAVCGTGMGSLAGLLREKGFHVTGSDQNVYPPMSTELESLGIQLFQGYSPDNLNKRPDLVIVGNAVSKTNPEVLAVLEQGISYCSMPEALSRFFITGKKSIVISGTHGKTTTTALLSHILKEVGTDPSYLIGGILQGGEKNYRLGNGDYFVIEGDEYDTAFFDKGPKFLHYQPFISVMTSLEFDHADIYRDLEHLTDSFRKLIHKTSPEGTIYACSSYKTLQDLCAEIGLIEKRKLFFYGKNSSDFWQLKNIWDENGRTYFEVHSSKGSWTLDVALPGEHNAFNSILAFAVCVDLGLDPLKVKAALASFRGVKRRQEIRAEIGNIIVMDDFAHHPTAVKETIAAVKKRYPAHKLWAVFEPRSNSSKRDIFQKDYARAEKVADGKILNIAKLTEDLLSQNLKARHLSGVESIVHDLVKRVQGPAVVLVMSNGGFGGIHEKLIRLLS